MTGKVDKLPCQDYIIDVRPHHLQISEEALERIPKSFRKHYQGGEQVIYRVGEHGLSCINGPLHHGFDYEWEIAVISFDAPNSVWGEIDMSTPLMDEETLVFRKEKAAHEFIKEAIKWMLEQLGDEND